MRSTGQFAAFLAVVLTVVGGWQYYLWTRLVRDPAWPQPYGRLATVAIVGAMLVPPLVIFSARYMSRATLHVIAATLGPLIVIAIAQLMIFVNTFTNAEKIPLAPMRTFLVLLNPFAPHLSSELWTTLNEKFNDRAGDITDQSWPVHDERLLIEDEVEIVVQINGKVRDRMMLRIEATEEQMKAAVLGNPKIQQLLAGKTVGKVVLHL